MPNQSSGMHTAAISKAELSNDPEVLAKQFAKELIVACLQAEAELPNPTKYKDSHVVIWHGKGVGAPCGVISLFIMNQQRTISAHCNLQEGTTNWTGGSVEILYPPDPEKFQFECQVTEQGITAKRITLPTTEA